MNAERPPSHAAPSPRPLQDVGQPNLFEDIFSHSSVPRIRFEGLIREEIDGRIVTFDPAQAVSADIHVTDTTFRDGQQARPPYTVEQIARLYEMLSRLGGPRGVIRQTEFFLYTRKDREALDRCRALGRRYPEITGWIRADDGDFRLVKEAGLQETGMLTSCSDYHIFLKMRKNRRQAMDDYLRLAAKAIEHGIRPRCHLEDVTRADVDGFVVPFVQGLVALSEQAPEPLRAKVRLCDTMGFGLTYPGAALPRSIPKLIHRMIHDAGVPPARLEWHGHNDFHKVHVNAATCWIYGAHAVNGSLLGFGERTGNPPLEGAVIEYVGLKGASCGADLRVITEIADYFRTEVGAHVPPNYPFVGSEFTVTRAGIHADGLRRDERIYNIFDTGALLNRPPRVAITDKSGVDGVVLWVNDYLGLKGADALNKIRVHKIARWVADQYAEGRTSAISDAELAEQVRVHLPEYAPKA
jgi:isopropylmalate/homocitrate/citramalate synthase